MGTQEISVELQYERHSDGRYYVTSENIPGFRMAGFNIDAIHADLNEVVKDLLKINSNFLVDDVRWVPSLEDVKKHLVKPSPEGRVVYVVSGTLAA